MKYINKKEAKYVYINDAKTDYLVTSSGEIYKYKNDYLKQIKTRLDKDGYNVVVLHYNGKSYYRRVARLVANAFIPNPYKLPEVNHKNGHNHSNDDVSNLEWCSHKENINHSWRTGLTGYGEKSSHHKLTKKKVKKLKLLLHNHKSLLNHCRA